MDLINKIKTFWQKKTDIIQAKKPEEQDKWVIALALLFRACEPMTHDCLRTKQEREVLEDDIVDHVSYCLHVKDYLERDEEPLSWDDWSHKIRPWGNPFNHRAFKADLQSKLEDSRRAAREKIPTDAVEPKYFSDLLTSLFKNRRF